MSTHDCVVQEYLDQKTVRGHSVFDSRPEGSIPLEQVFEGLKTQLGWLAPPDEDGDTISVSDCYGDAHSSITNGELRAWEFSGTIQAAEVWLYVAESPYEATVEIRAEETPWSKILSSWEWGVLEFPEFLESFDLHDAAIEALEAPEEPTEKCRIWKEHSYYAGTLGRPADGFVRGEDGEQLVFDDSEQAQAWIDAEEEGRYVLKHGEASRPSYYICV